MSTVDALPTIIQGGMGAGISDWRLARAVSSRGQLGVVSGTALDVILARRLQMGDPGGHMRRGLDRFPVPAVADRIYQKYYVAGGKPETRPFAPVPLWRRDEGPELVELCIAANFQVRGRGSEPGIVTSGDDLGGVGRFMPPGTARYTAADVLHHLLHPESARHESRQRAPAGADRATVDR